MADGKMFLKCDSCKEVFMLAKRFGDGYFVRTTNNGEESFEAKFNAFLSDHSTCTESADWPDHFAFEYE